MEWSGSAEGRWYHHMKNQLAILEGLSKVVGDSLDRDDPNLDAVRAIHAATLRALTLLDERPTNHDRP